MSEAVAVRAERPLVLVTGASGKIGRRVVKELGQRGFRVRAMTSKIRTERVASGEVEWRVKDFTTSLDFSGDVDGCAAVVHLAAEIWDMPRMERVNVDATRELVRASERASIAAFCYTSSASVYGSSLSRIVTEESPTITPDEDVRSEYSAPRSLRAYGRTKLLGEIALREEAREAEYIILRPTMVVDADDVLRLGNARYLRKSLIARRHAHHVYIADVAYAIVWFLDQALARNEPRAGVSLYNVAEDDYPEPSYEAIFRKLRLGTGSNFRVFSAPAIADQLVNCCRFGSLPTRYTFGEMFFAVDKLKSETVWPCYGLERLYGQALGQIARDRGDSE